jgi:hypothetical protein
MTRIKQRQKDIAECAGCRTKSVQVITSRPGWLTEWWGWLTRRQYFLAWCQPCHLARCDAGRNTRWAWVWWLPEPTTATWAAIDRYLPDEPPGCCWCGGWAGPSQVAIWGPGCGPEEAEVSCLTCFTRPRPPGRWNPGCTYADLGPHYTVEDWRRLSAAAWIDRQPIEGAA